MVDDTLPTRLRLGPVRVTPCEEQPELSLIPTDQALHQLEAEPALLQALTRFRGQPGEEVRTELREALGVEIDDDGLQRLVNIGVLVGVPE